ncbi:uncharacterized protein LOC144076166 isoform X2 [Stigmatopora argus]
MTTTFLQTEIQSYISRTVDSTLNSGDATFQMRLAMHAASNEMVPELLQSRWEDAEEILWQLGFGHDVQELTVRIPLRFLSSPSQARGINFRLFLDSQVRRIREEDPSFSIASRFRQVQALTAMANAFCSLYSHVSRTPLRKLGAPKFTFTVSSAPASARSDGKSRVGRLKDAVCLPYVPLRLNRGKVPLARQYRDPRFWGRETNSSCVASRPRKSSRANSQRFNRGWFKTVSHGSQRAHRSSLFEDGQQRLGLWRSKPVPPISSGPDLPFRRLLRLGRI